MHSSPLTIYSSFSHFPLYLLFLLSIILLSPWIGASENQFKLDGKVLELDESNLDAAISNFDYIFIEFYAMWCGHCKDLEPELDKAAPILAGLKKPIAVAKVDAIKYKKLAKKHEVDRYPTLKIFMHGVPTEYFGPRKADLLVKHVAKYIAPDVALLSSDSAIRDFIKEAGTNFPIFIGFGLNEAMIANLAVKYKTKAWFSVAKDFSDDIMTIYDFDKVPALAAIHPVYDEHSTFYGPFEDKFLEDYIKQSLLPLILHISEESLKSLKDDQRKILLTLIRDEADEKSKGFLEVLKASASANRDLIFGYVGVKQSEDFAESFEVNMETQLPKMIVWDGGDAEDYYTVNGSETIDGTDMGTQVSRFLEGYREGNVIQKRIVRLTLMSFITSQLGMIALVLVVVVPLSSLILKMINKEPWTDGIRDKANAGRISSIKPVPETRGLRQATSLKED
ncbi:hypothetical protein RD792_011080 [Penstemon davidsonii]|uniref:Thioredoxin domain-containing protein n=1 Tax=Penstemon davidsonii TaxID=160366 RepID=A0ABR0D3K8_9LAMI|nr:hypothetical protein RD792_011080 [Penstemon davidsonii]